MLLQESLVTGRSSPLPVHPTHPTKTALPLGEAADVTSVSDTGTLIESVADIHLSAPPSTSRPTDGKLAHGDGAKDVEHERFWQVAAKNLVPLKAPWLDFVPVRAEGTVLYDKSGREMLDFTSGQMSSLLGQ